MIFDFENFHNYRENNRIEFKSALGGLPQSIWETYSSFANSLGGVILLGVEEMDNKAINILSLPDPEKLVHDFWNTVNNRQKVSINILTDKDINIIDIHGKHIVTIEIPQANRRNKPVYIGPNPFTGAYRRNGQGDYHCTEIEVQNMMRDKSDISQDQKIIENKGLDVFDYESLKRYRNRLAAIRPGHVWESLDDVDFLRRLGAIEVGEDKVPHPTAAGLLMFSFEYEICREFPHYFLDYQERMDDVARWTDRFISNTGEWSGNVHDFYFHVQNKLTQEIKRPFALKDGWERIDDTSVHKAIREALLNSLIHANFYDSRGLVVVKERDRITISNPGSMRVSIEEAIYGGKSDPRNQTLVKMFTLLGLVERAGSGVPNIFSVWREQGWDLPELREEFNPDRTILSLVFGAVDKKMAIKSGDKNVNIASGTAKKKISDRQKEKLTEVVANGESLTTTQAAVILGVRQSRARLIIGELVRVGVLEAYGANRDRVYRLKKS
jgi:predicted HTH transcriptional regulator